MVVEEADRNTIQQVKYYLELCASAILNSFCLIGVKGKQKDLFEMVFFVSKDDWFSMWGYIKVLLRHLGSSVG